MSTTWSDYVQTPEQLYQTRALRFRDEYAADFRRELGLDACTDILEIGCGPGALCAALARWYPRARVTGLDLDERFLDYAKARHPDLRFAWGDATRLPYPDGSFDATTSHTVQEHVETVAFLGEQRRVLRPGGVMTVLSSRTRMALFTESFWQFPESVKAIPHRACARRRDEFSSDCACRIRRRSSATSRIL